MVRQCPHTHTHTARVFSKSDVSSCSNDTANKTRWLRRWMCIPFTHSLYSLFLYSTQLVLSDWIFCSALTFIEQNSAQWCWWYIWWNAVHDASWVVVDYQRLGQAVYKISPLVVKYCHLVDISLHKRLMLKKIPSKGFYFILLPSAIHHCNAKTETYSLLQ